MSQDKKQNKKGLHLSEELYQLSVAAAQGYFASEVAFVSVSAYMEFLRQKGRELNHESALIALRTSLYEANYHFVNLANGFEFYLENLALRTIREHPHLMLGKDGMDQPIKPSISYEDLIARLDEGIDAGFLSEKYISRFKSGPAYLNFIRLFDNITGKTAIDKKAMQTLRWYYKARNEITHGGGTVDIDKIPGETPTYMDKTKDYIPRIGLFEAIHFFLSCGMQIETELQLKFRDFEAFIHDPKEIFGLAITSSDLADDHKSFVSGELDYFGAAVRRVKESENEETSPPQP